ncbi:MAG TPA: hypothetical protein VGY54_15350, partial [Polyangiaceae bacterium]|nr:hypothetical protein [Polyangiaceae bacterium]
MTSPRSGGIRRLRRPASPYAVLGAMAIACGFATSCASASGVNAADAKSDASSGMVADAGADTTSSVMSSDAAADDGSVGLAIGDAA